MDLGGTRLVRLSGDCTYGTICTCASDSFCVPFSFSNCHLQFSLSDIGGLVCVFNMLQVDVSNIPLDTCWEMMIKTSHI